MVWFGSSDKLLFIDNKFAHQIISHSVSQYACLYDLSAPSMICLQWTLSPLIVFWFLFVVRLFIIVFLSSYHSSYFYEMSDFPRFIESTNAILVLNAIFDCVAYDLGFFLLLWNQKQKPKKLVFSSKRISSQFFNWEWWIYVRARVSK